MFLRCLAWSLKNLSWFRDFVIRSSQKNPYFDIYDPNGDLYMGRYWFMPRWTLGRDEDGNLFPKEWVRKLIPIVRIHHINREDRDPYLHDHPCDFTTIIMQGSYLEECQDGIFRLRKSGDIREATYDNC